MTEATPGFCDGSDVARIVAWLRDRAGNGYPERGGRLHDIANDIERRFIPDPTVSPHADGIQDDEDADDVLARAYAAALADELGVPRLPTPTMCRAQLACCPQGCQEAEQVIPATKYADLVQALREFIDGLSHRLDQQRYAPPWLRAELTALLDEHTP